MGQCPLRERLPPRQHSGRHGRCRGRALKRMPLARKARMCVLAAIRATLGPWGSRAPSAACCAGRTREVGAAVPGTCPWMTPLKAAAGVLGEQHALFAMRFFFLDTLPPPHPDTEGSAFPCEQTEWKGSRVLPGAGRSRPGLRTCTGATRPAAAPTHPAHPRASLLRNRSVSLSSRSLAFRSQGCLCPCS